MIPCGQLTIEVTDQSYADAGPIHTSGLAMGTYQLFNPSWGYFDLSVTLAQGTIVYQEVLSYSLPKSPVFVHTIDQRRFSKIRCRVMNDDVLPTSSGI